MAKCDPDRAARLLTDAERIADSITGKPAKASALGGIAQAVAATDPGRAERIANSILDKLWKPSARHRIETALWPTISDKIAKARACGRSGTAR